MQAKAFQHLFRAGGHSLVFGGGLLRRRDRDQFDLLELVLADHAAGVLPRRARLGAEAERAGGIAQRQTLLVDDALANEVGERDFRRGDQPTTFQKLSALNIPPKFIRALVYRLL